VRGAAVLDQLLRADAVHRGGLAAAAAPHSFVARTDSLHR
jgi:hypothetical protein